MYLPTHQIISHNKDSRPSYAQFLHFRPGIAVMEGVLLWQREHENFWTRPGYGVFGGHLMVSVTITAAYVRTGSPLKAFSALTPPVPVLHLYAQPADPAFLQAQQSLAAAHPWFHVQRLQARSHFPMFEVPDEMATAIETFVTG